MSTMADPSRPITGGVDTHLEFHVAAVVDDLGRVLGTETFPASSAGYRTLLAWMRGHGPLRRVGIEGTGAYGAGLARSLTHEGVEGLEVNRPDRSARRAHGKSDPGDAEAAAEHGPAAEAGPARRRRGRARRRCAAGRSPACPAIPPSRRTPSRSSRRSAARPAHGAPSAARAPARSWRPAGPRRMRRSIRAAATAGAGRARRRWHGPGPSGGRAATGAP